MSARITWHNDTSNETQTWVMNGDGISRRVTALDEHGQPIFVGPPWHIVAAHKHEIIWHNEQTNETQIWFMSSTGDRITRRATVHDENDQPIFVGLPWRIVGASQMSGVPLGPSSIIWHNGATNETQIWFMNDANLVDNGWRIASRATVRDEMGQPIFVGLPWRIVGTSLQQIVWYNDSTGETQIWDVSADKISRRMTVQDEQGQAIFVGPPWRIMGTADFNSDPLRHHQRTDIVWHNDTTNAIQIWVRQDEGHRIARRPAATDENRQPIFVGLPWRIVACTNDNG